MTIRAEIVEKIINSRKFQLPETGARPLLHKAEAEGGCGVIGVACSERIPARHLLQPLRQMRNRGNGKGGGVAAVGLVAEQFGVSQQVLENNYLLTIAYLTAAVQSEVERDFVSSAFHIDHVRPVPHLTGAQELGTKPPEVVQYFVRVKPELTAEFMAKNGLDGTNPALSLANVEDEIVYQNVYLLNRAFYASTGDKRALVLSCGKNMLVLKLVGYGDDVIRYYELGDLHAHVWIGHHRYPTKGKVWHPGGAHPFVALHEALVHNGDFANYSSMCEYLAQRNIYPLFLTDTEVSVLVFDLLHRTYGYPLEYVIECLAPTTERDFVLLPDDKQQVYRLLQTVHIHGSPDGPWFFLIAQSAPMERAWRLIGITDTSMLRPQVFALQKGAVSIGLAASEKQAIDAVLESLAAEDPRFWTHADLYWNARGGSHTDGGAFIFTIKDDRNGFAHLVCTDKFGRPIQVSTTQQPYCLNLCSRNAHPEPPDVPGQELFTWVKQRLLHWNYDELLTFLKWLEGSAETDDNRRRAFEVLTLLTDRHYPTGSMRRSNLLSLFDHSLAATVESIRKSPSLTYRVVCAGDPLPRPESSGQTFVIDARGFASQGKYSLARAIVRLHQCGCRKLLVAHAKGHRFIASGLGPGTRGARIDVYGSPGDYLGSGIDGAEIVVHGSAQDQLAQIMKDGKLVVYGDVGQTFLYAAKGGQAFVLGNAAGRPLINAVGKPRVLINGTCLDYLGESFMAGNPLDGGGFVILNGITLSDEGQVRELDAPYPGSNLFSLASGGAIYIRDPYSKVSDEQLNGGEFVALEEHDWVLIKSYLVENERLFGIPLARLLEVNGRPLLPQHVYRKIRPRTIPALQAEEAWVKMQM
jgi:glutamate synthase domain-containing protein 1/glutamate synthase domain-containing protein 3